MGHACRCGHGDGTLAVDAQPRCYTGEERAGEVASDPVALAVLERFGLNHCCGGHLSLREGAAAAGVELPVLLQALQEAAGHPA